MASENKIPYADYVNKNAIIIKKSQDGENRYLLSVKFINVETPIKELVVIMKNPSCADKSNSDKTVNQVLDFAHKKGYSEVHILNLYSYYSTDSKKIKELINNGNEDKAIGEDNDLVIKETIKDIQDIIIAWGTSPKGMKKSYEDRVTKVLKFLKDKNLYFVSEDYSKSLYPRHPQVWASKAANLILEKWNVKID